MMKKLYFLPLCLFILTVLQSTDTKAYHVTGGEITWTCLSNGKFVFRMNIYKDCAAPFVFQDQILSYQGGTIVLQPDSTLWLNLGNGNISHKGSTGCQLSCTGSQSMGIEVLPFVSDPVTLNGVPPQDGWLFTWGPICCRSSVIENLSKPSASFLTLRAKMYPYKGKNINHCYDSSPQFGEFPSFFVYRETDNIYNPAVFDQDLDSLVFSWAKPWDNINAPVSFSPGYSFDEPMPDSTAHPLNKKASLHKGKGEISFSTHSGYPFQQYITALQVDAYRNGYLIASIYRDAPFIMIDRPNIPETPFVNNPPISLINGAPAKGFMDTIFAGQKIVLPFQSIDNDIIYKEPSDVGPAAMQRNTLSPNGLMFSEDFTDTFNCKDSAFAPCATLTPAPIFNPNTGNMELWNQGTVTTLFEWQTDCNHLFTDSNEMSNGRTFNFIMKTYDDHCDVPGIIYPSISITVLPFIPEIHQNGNILSVDSADSYQWFYNENPIPNSDTNLINMLSNGWYSVEVIRNGCPSKRAYHLLNVSLDELDLEGNINIYPNPFKDGFIVDRMGNSRLELKYELMDLSGRSLKIISSSDKGKTLINIEKDISQGIYFLKVTSPNSSMIKKVVKM